MARSSFRNRGSWLLLAAVMGLGACAEAELVAHTAKQTQQQREARSEQRMDGYLYKVGNPYQINGIWYYPQIDYSYQETGIASWYGPGFHGLETANGERFDENELTAAHRTLPMPSMVRVTNLENGRSLKLRVNDRGPFAHGRIIDVSRRAAQLLGFENQGTAQVRVEILEEESRQLAGEAPSPRPNQEPLLRDASYQPDPDQAGSQGGSDAQPAAVPAVAEVEQGPAEPGSIFVQAGAFTNYDNAHRLRDDLASLASAEVTTAQVDQRAFYRVRLGPVTEVAEADRLLERLLDKGYSDARVVID